MEYPCGSFLGYCSSVKKTPWLDYAWLLCTFFGNDDSAGRALYRSYVYSGINGEIGNPFDDVVHQVILGKDTFAGEMKERITGRFELKFYATLGFIKKVYIGGKDVTLERN